MSRITQVQTFARFGYLARGVVYILLGYFALTSGGGSGTTDILDQIKDAPAGSVLLFLVGVGLLGYGIFRLYGAALDIQGHGTDALGIGKRIGHAVSGLMHFFLSFYALKAVFSDGGGSGGGTREKAAGTLADMPGGEILLGLIGLALFAAGVSQAHKAWSGKFMKQLDADAPHYVEYLGRAGYGARAVVFAVLGWFVVQASMADDGEQVRGIGGALTALRDTGWLFTLVAFGLLLFGIFSLFMARYRTIRNEDVLKRLKHEARKHS